MTPAYDFEAVHVAADDLAEAIKTMLAHDVNAKIGWRLKHMLRELGEFRFVLFGV